MKYIENNSTDPHYNLAFEEYIFKNLDKEDFVLLWRNGPSIIVGKNTSFSSRWSATRTSSRTCATSWPRSKASKCSRWSSATSEGALAHPDRRGVFARNHAFRAVLFSRNEGCLIDITYNYSQNSYSKPRKKIISIPFTPQQTRWQGMPRSLASLSSSGAKWPMPMAM